MRKRAMAHDFVSIIVLILLTSQVVAADLAADVETLLREIRQDRPVPELDYLRRAASINADCAYFLGRHGDIEIQVETHPNSPRVASVLLRIPGPDRTQALLPAVTRVLGPPHSSDPQGSNHVWEWPNYRAASLHYADQGATATGSTIVSLFYH